MQKKNFKKLVGSDAKSGVSFPSFKLLSKTFKLNYFKLNKNNISRNLNKIIRLNSPTLIEVNMPPFQELVPRVQNRLNKSGSFSAPLFDDLYPSFIFEK